MCEDEGDGERGSECEGENDSEGVRMRVIVSVVVRVRAKMIVSVWGEGEDGLSLKWVDENENWRKLDYYIYNTGRKSCSSLYNITFFFLILIDDLSTFLFSTFFFRPFYLRPYSSKPNE